VNALKRLAETELKHVQDLRQEIIEKKTTMQNEPDYDPNPKELELLSERHGLRLKHVNGQYLKASDIIENIKSMQI
jgi:hypothetical protein